MSKDENKGDNNKLDYSEAGELVPSVIPSWPSRRIRACPYSSTNLDDSVLAHRDPLVPNSIQRRINKKANHRDRVRMVPSTPSTAAAREMASRILGSRYRR